MKSDNPFGQTKSVKKEVSLASCEGKTMLNGSTAATGVKAEEEGAVSRGGYEGGSEDECSDEDIPDDAFHMITQYNWEEDIIWNGDDLKHKVWLVKTYLMMLHLITQYTWEDIIWNGDNLKH